MDKKRISLYVVPTPIGNLGDITLRALETLKSVDSILAEDTRTSGILLKHYSISKPLHSFHIFNEHKALSSVINKLKGGETMALVSDAGTPGISDPGFLLVRECLKNNLEVDCLPGATAFVPALIKSGFPTDRFAFEGFLPHKKGRQTLLKKLSKEERTIILYESPHRLIKLLEQIQEYFGAGRVVSVSRELTKMHEETFTGQVDEAISHFGAKEVKGEIVVIVKGGDKNEGRDDDSSEN